jgi:hypothetical protein
MIGGWATRPASMQLVAIAVSASALLSSSAPRGGTATGTGTVTRPGGTTTATATTPAERTKVQADSPILIDGSLDGSLYPGATFPVIVSLTNPNGFSMSIKQMTVRIDKVTAAGGGHCNPDDFAVQQFSGAYGFVLGIFRTATLTELGMTPAQLPQLTMFNRPDEDQSGCKGASIQLKLTCIATEAAV